MEEEKEEITFTSLKKQVLNGLKETFDDSPISFIGLSLLTLGVLVLLSIGSFYFFFILNATFIVKIIILALICAAVGGIVLSNE